MPSAPVARKDAAGRLRRALPLLALLAVFAAVLWPVLDPDVQLHYRDTARLYYPVKRFIAEELARGRLPFWYPWIESGTSLLGQVTPGLLHPLTLLYAALPFELAFKLNHLLALPAAGACAYLLCRRLGSSRWAAAGGGLSYGGCGWVTSMAASNLPYALGAATVPLAVERLLAFAESPGPLSLFLASGALALCAYAGEPQAMLFAGLVGGSYLVARAALGALPGAAAERARRGLRAAKLVALWGGFALLLSAPASFPAAVRLTQSRRLGGVNAIEQAMFAVAPARLLGYVVPLAFDDPAEPPPGAPMPWASPYREYFCWETLAAFSDSICVGPVVALLALFALGAGRKGRFLLLGALVLALASTGDALDVQRLVMRLIPLLHVFRYAEKYAGPTSLLLCMAAALGADAALDRGRRAARWLLGLSGGLSAAAAGLAVLSMPMQGTLLSALMEAGATHDSNLAVSWLLTLRTALWLCAGLLGALALAALLRLRREASGAALALAAAACAAAVMALAPRQLLVLPLDAIRDRSPLAGEMLRRAGPSEGRWRLYTNTAPVAVPIRAHLDERVAGFVSTRRSLLPQFEVIDRIESTSQYFTVGDGSYGFALRQAPRVLFDVLGVRFALAQPFEASPALARKLGFQRLPQGYWLGEYPLRPRAFLVGQALALPPEREQALLQQTSFEARRSATLPLEAAAAVAGLDDARPIASAVKLVRPSSDRFQLSVDAPRPALLVLGEHFDAGWSARIDGQPARLFRTDLAVIGMPMPAGRHEVALRFVPRGFVVGMVALGVALASLLAWAARRRVLSSK